MQRRQTADDTLTRALRINEVETHIAMERLRAILALCKARA